MAVRTAHADRRGLTVTSGPADDLFRLLAEWNPGSVLVVGGTLPGNPVPGASVTRVGACEAPESLEAAGRFDAAVLLADEAMDAAATELILGRLKNVHAPRVAAVVGQPDPARLRALAFEPVGGSLWVHDIDRYNPRREWNSADDWAHPENFDKYRW
jgi:hypothetical protein